LCRLRSHGDLFVEQNNKEYYPTKCREEENPEGLGAMAAEFELPFTSHDAF
jgi:hypothetical protein